MLDGTLHSQSRNILQHPAVVFSTPEYSAVFDNRLRYPYDNPELSGIARSTLEYSAIIPSHQNVFYNTLHNSAIVENAPQYNPQLSTIVHSTLQ